MTDGIDPRPFERFLFHEAGLLDARRFDDWLALFAGDGWYWVPIEENQASPEDTVSIIYDDRRMLETRVRRLTAAHGHALDPLPRTSRLVGNVAVAAADTAAGAYEIASRFQMVEYRLDRQRLFAGACRHRLLESGEGFRIAWKRVDLVNCDGMLDGISVPF